MSSFYVLAFGLTWVFWLPSAAHARGLFPFTIPGSVVLGGLGPGLACWVVLRMLRGKSGERALWEALSRWRVPVLWYAVAIGAPLAIALAVVVFAGRLGSLQSWPSLGLVITFVTYLLSAIPEEVGWRGFALPLLQDRHSALLSSLIVGVLWTVWHFPLIWDPSDNMSSIPLVSWALGTVAISVVYTWLFNSTRGSILIVVLFHAAANTANSLAAGYLRVEAVVAVLAAVTLVGVLGAAQLCGGGRVRQAPLPCRERGIGVRSREGAG